MASADARATAAAVAMLKADGNAADAAVAAALALAVVFPQAGNLGGGGFAVARFGAAVTALDFRETAPALATAAMYVDATGTPRPEASLVGPLAAAVPGTPVGLYALQRQLGRLPWAAVVAPAIALARDGFAVDTRLMQTLTRRREVLLRFAPSAARWLPQGQPLRAGDWVTLPSLASTLTQYAARGPEAIVTGEVAAAIAAASAAYGGVLTGSDLAGYRARWRAPRQLTAFGWHVAVMDLPSSAGLLFAETLGILERRGFAALPPGTADRPHLWAEAWRRAFADRARLGDPETLPFSVDTVVQPAWLNRRAGEIDMRAATPASAVSPWPGLPLRATETTHLSVIDGQGGAVAMTLTLNAAFGGGLWVDAIGFLNNEMDDFATAPGRPNLYGLVQGANNAVAPGRRPLSSMAPTIAWRGDATVALGSPGGSRIPTATLQVLLARIVDGDDLQTAVARPRIHHQWLPDELVAEAGALAPAVQRDLLQRGHAVVAAEWAVGEVHAVERNGRAYSAAADPRGPGAGAVVW